MGEMIDIKNNLPDNTDKEAVAIQIAEDLLLDARTNVAEHSSMKMPITELGSLGVGAAALLPAMKAIMQSYPTGTQQLYQLANAGVGDFLKVAKNGNFWGAMKNVSGKSTMAQFKAVDPMNVGAKAAEAINPATMMMAVALFSIEKELGNIAEMERQILSFLQIEKESEIEADIKMLTNIISQYKYNWDNELFIASNHKLVRDIQRTARKNMFTYQKSVEDVISKDKLLVAQNMVDSAKTDLVKKFKYYRLSLYAFSLASLLEIMLSGNFKEENISGIRKEIEENTMVYMELYSQCSMYLEKMSHASVEANALKGLGIASNAIGKMVEKMPVVNKGPVDEFLRDSGEHLKTSAKDIEIGTIASFATISNPATRMFIERMNDMIQIYNHTDRICFDENNIYLVAG